MKSHDWASCMAVFLHGPLSVPGDTASHFALSGWGGPMGGSPQWLDMVRGQSDQPSAAELGLVAETRQRSLAIYHLRIADQLVFARRFRHSEQLRQPLTATRLLCRNHRGLRHYWGLRVKGQHTKTTGRRGKTVGVAKKK